MRTCSVKKESAHNFLRSGTSPTTFLSAAAKSLRAFSFHKQQQRCAKFDLCTPLSWLLYCVPIFFSASNIHSSLEAHHPAFLLYLFSLSILSSPQMLLFFTSEPCRIGNRRAGKIPFLISFSIRNIICRFPFVGSPLQVQAPPQTSSSTSTSENTLKHILHSCPFRPSLKKRHDTGN